MIYENFLIFSTNSKNVYNTHVFFIYYYSEKTLGNKIVEANVIKIK